MRSLLGLIILLALAAPVLAATTQPVVVFAGTASQPPLEEAAKAFEEKTGIPVVLHLGGSGAMLSQIRLTGQGDLYIPGSPDYMDKAKDFGLVTDNVSRLAYLIPAILVAKGNPHRITGLKDLTRPGLRIGLADPESVCVGLYAVELLETNGIAEKVKPNVHGMVESCAKAAAMIPLNLVDVVLGWREFAPWNREVMDVVLIKGEEIPRLAYIPAAPLLHSHNPKGAAAFIAFLKSSEGQAFFEKWGYFTSESSARQFASRARIGGSYTLPEGW
ncbi:MAG: molybdate ABC transporter substrate-binding protein [Desulfuromonadales bacterium]|nr:molybdate ABC transporter substrate-binding protein [Desulfuromonadales bacterium]